MDLQSEMESNPWLHPYIPLLDDAEIVRRAQREPAPFNGPLSLGIGPTLLRNKLEEIFVCTPSATKILRHLLGISMGHLLESYPSPQEFVQRLYKKEHGFKALPNGQRKMTLITGLSGTGKSQVMQALSRITPSSCTISGIPYHADVENEPLWMREVSAHESLKSLLTSFVRVNAPKAYEQSASVIAYKKGVGRIAVDEVQFQTMSASAITTTTNTLKKLSDIGPPLVACCNYSLVHKIRNRAPHEVRNRVLADAHVLLPDTPDSSEWRIFIETIVRVAGSWLDISLEKDLDSLYAYSHGIKKNVVDLVCYAFQQMLEDGKESIQIEGIRRAYISVRYEAQRSDINALSKIASGVKQTRPDTSLVCPFELSENYTSSVKNFWEGLYKGQAMAAVHKSAAPIQPPPQMPTSTQKPVAQPKVRKKRSNAKELMESSMRFAANLAQPSR
ncbi:hypothetical protein [Herbaspirillum robiniae]|uniref:hypothetical protein n=1 Tax=Herbaspirillum robiniae TaxID=2014887 RepID=UPI00101AE8E5|nr:hypothetical protein [Herbaspirillum robiniae]